MRRLSVMCFLTINLILLISPSRAAGWTAETNTLDLIVGPAGRAAFLAPDGSRFAYYRDREICIYSLDGERGNCVETGWDIRIDVDTVRWSPDSTKLAFSEEFFVNLRDSDIWLYDNVTNLVTSLTPTPNRELKLYDNSDPDSVFTVDMIPQWSADSQSIYFIRYQFKKPEEARAVFYRVGVDGSEPVEVSAVKTNGAFSTYAFAISPDNSSIVYNLDTGDDEPVGTWLLDLTTDDSKFVAAAYPQTEPLTYQYASNGKLLLNIGKMMDVLNQIQHPELSPIYTLPLFDDQQLYLNTDQFVFSGGWSPNDSTLVYTTYNPDDAADAEQGLYITDTPDEKGELVLSGRFFPPTPSSRVPLLWAANNTLLLSQSPDFNLVVVKLSPA